MKWLTMGLLIGVVFGAGVSAGDSRTPSPEGAEVYIISPKEGAKVGNPVIVRFGLKNMGVAPAGVEKANTGHHHILIDVPLPDFTMPVPSDDTHRHFGGGQTEVVLDLSPGRHTLQLILADRFHIPHSPPVFSKPISITVE